MFFFLIIQVRDFKFMCPNDTVFDQENFICANWFEIDCRSSTFFYDKNLALFQPDERNKGATGGTMTSTTEEPSEQQKRQQEQQLKQLMVLEEQQAAQVLRQQQVLEQHEKRQQEHQVTFCAKLSISSLTTFSTCPNETNSVAQCVALRSLCSLHRIIFILFKLFTKPRHQFHIWRDKSKCFFPPLQRNQLKIIQDQQKQLEKQQGRKISSQISSNSRSSSSTTTTTPYPEEKGEESIIEYDYYYYDYEDSSEHGNFYANDDYDPKAPGRIIDPTNARPPLLPILPPVKTPLDSSRQK